MSASSDTFENLFLGDEQNFLGLPMRFARDDARGYIVSHKNSHRPLYWR